MEWVAFVGTHVRECVYLHKSSLWSVCARIRRSINMAIPYSNRVVLGTIPTLALATPPALTVRELNVAINESFPDRQKSFLSVQIYQGRKFRLTLASSEHLEDIISHGLTFRGFPLVLAPVSLHKWVTVTELPYGFPPETITEALRPYGESLEVKMETCMGRATGTRLVRMTVKKNIPSRVRIAGHPCNVFYRGQTRTCFRCGEAGHQTRNCPHGPRRGPLPPGDENNRVHHDDLRRGPLTPAHGDPGVEPPRPGPLDLDHIPPEAGNEDPELDHTPPGPAHLQEGPEEPTDLINTPLGILPTGSDSEVDTPSASYAQALSTKRGAKAQSGDIRLGQDPSTSGPTGASSHNRAAITAPAAAVGTDPTPNTGKGAQPSASLTPMARPDDPPEGCKDNGPTSSNPPAAGGREEVMDTTTPAIHSTSEESSSSSSDDSAIDGRSPSNQLVIGGPASMEVGARHNDGPFMLIGSRRQPLLSAAAEHFNMYKKVPTRQVRDHSGKARADLFLKNRYSNLSDESDNSDEDHTTTLLTASGNLRSLSPTPREHTIPNPAVVTSDTSAPSGSAPSNPSALVTDGGPQD